MVRFLILLFYYNRDNIVYGALQSLIESTYQNFKVACIDDGSDIPLKTVIQQKFPQLLDKCVFYRIDDTKQDKIARGGSIFGRKANQAIEDIESDIVLMLCDDDMLYPTYLEELDQYYSKNAGIDYSYSHIILYDPSKEDINEVRTRTEASDHLKHTVPMYPFNRLDSTQVSWRRKCNIEGNCWFAFPRTYNLDADLYQKLFDKYGYCPWNGSIGQYKGWCNLQLCHKINYSQPNDADWYENTE